MFSGGNVAPMFLRILSRFPPNISFAFAYGSGVKQQLGAAADRSRNMIDLILAVDNPYHWHAANLERHPSHYSSLMRFLDSRAIAKYQERFAARIYFNTLVPIEEENVLIKYGVISTNDLLADLLDWRDLYVAGRLHKPVEVIRPPSSAKLQLALENNVKNAVHATLLLLPAEFTEYEFYYTAASLSYLGDFRMTFGEDKDKVRNIVRPQLEAFRMLYAPTVRMFHESLQTDGVTWKQDTNEKIVLHHLNQLPKWPTRRIVRQWNRGRYKQDTEDVLRAVAHMTNYRDQVAGAINAIVFQSSAKQSIKNIPTAGLLKSLRYSWAKIQKMFNLPATT